MSGTVNSTEKCYCGSDITYAECCKPYITGERFAPTPEALMRSRYSAYVVHAIDYSIDTTHEQSKENMSREAIKKWSEKSKWKGLKIIAVSGGEEGSLTGTVQFEASYEMDFLSNVHHEIATFEKDSNRWFYVDGEVVPKTVVRVGEKIGRNVPCPCGSDKKYKYCCGRG